MFHLKHQTFPFYRKSFVEIVCILLGLFLQFLSMRSSASWGILIIYSDFSGFFLEILNCLSFSVTISFQIPVISLHHFLSSIASNCQCRFPFPKSRKAILQRYLNWTSDYNIHYNSEKDISGQNKHEVTAINGVINLVTLWKFWFLVELIIRLWSAWQKISRNQSKQ